MLANAWIGNVLNEFAKITFLGECEYRKNRIVKSLLANNFKPLTNPNILG